MRLASCTLLFGLLPLLVGCASLTPYHTAIPRADSAPNCNAAAPAWLPSDACAGLVIEHADDYDLVFAEFDDQGWPFRGAAFGGAARQIDVAVDTVERAIRASHGRVSIVTFVHGWKHNAAYDDVDVRQFRSLLTGLNHIEGLDQGCRRRVIGVYAGWRGQSLDIDDNLQNITFWERKETAGKVAQGTIRELFARIRTLQIKGNRSSQTASDDPCVMHPVRSMIAGHSFGGLIVFSVLSEALIRDISDIRSSEAASDADLSLSREGDLVLLVNPAIEATRFDALARSFADESRYRRYHAPLFVSITSVDDLATRIAFPMGRRVSTLFDRYTPGNESVQRSANLETLGQDDDYITMNLTTLGQYNAARAPGERLEPLPTCAGYNDSFPPGSLLREHIKRERETFESFRVSLGQPPNAAAAYPRQFCGMQDMVLSLAADVDPNSPVWNIRTRSPIVSDHGDITNPLLWQFARQLYFDSEYNLAKALRGSPR